MGFKSFEIGRKETSSKGVAYKDGAEEKLFVEKIKI